MGKSAPKAIFIHRDETVIHVRRLIETLERKGVDVAEVSASASADAAFVENLPAWVARYGVLIDGCNTWIYCEPRIGARSGPSDQILLRTSSARYLVDSFDAKSGTCVARESADAAPLVAGLPFTGRPLVLWVRPVGSGVKDARSSAGQT